MSDASQREWRFYLDDRVDFAGKVLTYTSGIAQAGFVARGLTCDATLRHLELTGEATTHPEIPWWMIIATLWRIIRDDTPKPLPQLKALKGEAQS